MIRTQDLRGYRPVETIEGEGYNCETLSHAVAYNRKQDESDSAYLLTEIETTSVPTAQADYVQDRLKMWTCNCHDYQYGQLKPFLKGKIALGEVGRCKHLDKHLRTKRAKQDDKQDTLV